MKIGEEFRPSTVLKDLYYIQVFLLFAVFVLPWFIPLALFVPVWISVLVLLFTLPLFLLGILWIYLYYPTIIYKLTDHEIVWKRGVWFRTTGIVQYNRITNVDIKQGPLSRMFGIASLNIQTAGYSATNARASEITIEGMKNFEEIRDVLMGFVRGGKPVAAQTFDEEDRVVAELVKIRKLLEKKR
jgi:membrane protein YdbS with pleckstrin-like domain